jgi:hypothetical protein
MYCPIFMGLGKNINCLYDISAKFETGLCEINESADGAESIVARYREDAAEVNV